jgi:hypothetical protein
MELFVRSTNTDMNMYAQIQNICKHRYLYIIILAYDFLEFCTRNYYTNGSLIKPTG